MASFLSRLTLRDRALIGYAVPTTLMFAFSGLVYLVAAKSFQTFEALAQQQQVLEIRSKVLAVNLNMDRRIRRYLMENNPEAIQLFNQDYQRRNELIARLKPLITDARQLAILEKKSQVTEQIKALGDRTLEQIRREGKVTKRLQLEYIEESVALTNRLEELHSELDGLLKVQSEGNIADAKSSLIMLEVMAVMSALLSLGVAVLMGLMISRALGRRVTNVVDVAERISTGDLTHSMTGKNHGGDEIGQLMGSFQNMAQRLNALISQVQRSSIQVTSSCTQLSASGRQLEGTITEQVASTNQVTTTAKQIAATSEELAKTMEELSDMSQMTSQTANGQQEDLMRMGMTMQQLAGATDLISMQLGAINEKANNITTIVGTITKVADQTNLLSLNAAIEAEKAGEYGLGFSVVAKEIRRLADQTAIATVDIEQMIKEMQSSVSVGVMEMDKFARDVRQGVVEVGTITTQVTQVIDQVQQLTPRFEAVNQGMEMQFQGAQQISEAMIQLSDASGQTADSLQEINRVIDHLSQAEQSLRREVMQFKIDTQTVDRPLAMVE
jgi:methyl-accepting chemotaxis protein WspA